MKKIRLALALASLVCVPSSPAVSFNDVQFWIGAGTNRAALVIEWSVPESLGGTAVPAPLADKSLVWGYRFNGPATGLQMFNAIVAADPRLYAVENVHPIYGTSVQGLGFHLGGGGDRGLADGTLTNYFTNGLLIGATVDLDAAAPLNPGDLYWGCQWGPNWEMWTEHGDAGGFLHAPDRGANPYWTSTDDIYASSGFHGEWDLAQAGLNGLPLTQGSWLGFSVAAAAYDFDLAAPYNAHKHAPAAPETALTALVVNFVGGPQGAQWQARFGSCTGWVYALERSVDLQNWTPVTSGVAGTGASLVIADPAPPAEKSFYRIRADHP